MASSFLAELKRRSVLRVAFAYLAGTWLLIQVVETLFPVFGLSDGAIRVVVIVLAIGFVPALVIAWAFEITPGGLVRDDDKAVSTGDAGFDKPTLAARVKSFDRVVLVVLALAVAFFAVDKFVLAPEQGRALSEATDAGAAAAIPLKSVAVLPFLNMSGDPQNEYFSDGLSETLLHMLAQLPDLLVSARTSSFAFKGQESDIRDIALALGVAHILEGSVQKARNRVRVTAQLIRAEDGFHLWSQNYDRALDDIFAIQDEIAADVARELGSTLLGLDGSGIKGVLTEDVEAYDIYLLGLEQQAIYTLAALDKAHELFEAALAQDPEFSDAAIALARNYQHKRSKWSSDDDDELLRKAIVLLYGVLNREPDNVAALGLRTMFEQFEALARNEFQEVDEGIEELLALMQRGVGDSYARRWLVQILSGRFERYDEALAVLREGLVADPLNFDLLWAQATLYTDMERYDEALQPLLTARTLAPTNPMVHTQLGFVSFGAGDKVGALDWTRQAADLDPEDRTPSFIIANNLYEYGFAEAANFWAERALATADADDELVWRLRLSAARFNASDEELAAVAQGAIDYFLETDRVLPPGAVLQYSWAMHRQGRAQEGIDYLLSKHPRVGDPTWLPPSRSLFNLHGYSRALRSDILKPPEFTREITTWITTLRESGLLTESLLKSYEGITLALGQDDEQQAKRLLSEINPATSTNMWIWLEQDPFPKFEAFRHDPEVAEQFAKAAAWRERTREQIAQMLERPEWQLHET
jgi:adenylate cyclase